MGVQLEDLHNVLLLVMLFAAAMVGIA